MFRRLLLAAAFVLLSVTAVSADVKVMGYAENGSTIVTAGIQSTSKARKVCPSASLRVNLAGTATAASIFSDNGITPKANPFTVSATDGSFSFYVDAGLYDLVFTGGGCTNYTLSDFGVVDASSTVSDASTTVKGIAKTSVAPASASDPITVGTNDPRVTEYYNLKFDFNASGGGATETTTQGSTVAGTTVVVASASTWQVNHGIFIAGAGAAGADYIGTVTNIVGTTFTVSPATSTTVPNGTLVRHDDSAAITAAWAACNTAKGCRIFAPAGIYNINVASTTVGTKTAKIHWPRRGAADGGITIYVQGESPPPPADSTVGSLAVPTGGTIFQTHDTTSAGALFGGDGPAFDNQTAVKFVLANAIVRIRNSNPTMVALDCQKNYTALIGNVRVDTNTETVNILSVPSNANGIGIRMPNSGNGVESQLFGVVSISGFYYGIEFGEHDDVDFLVVFACKYVAKLPFAYFPTTIRHLVSANSQNGLHVTDHHRLQIINWSIEHYHTSLGIMPAWMETVLDIQDDLNRLTGSLQLSVLSVQVGNVQEFAYTGLQSFGSISYVDFPVIDGRIFSTASNSIPTGGSTTTIDFPSETSDPYGMHSTVTNPSRVTIQFPGTYVFTVSAEWPAGTTGMRRIHLKKNGSIIDEGDSPAPPTGAMRQTVTFPVFSLVKNDYIEVALQQDNGTSLSVARVVFTWQKIQ